MSAEPSSDTWQMVFFAAAGLLVLLQTWRGWRLGVVRQVFQILALAFAYACAWFGGPLFVPYLRSAGLPDILLRVLAGAVVGVAVYLIVSFISSVLFKKTEDQKFGLIRFGYGAAGALLGCFTGLVLVWIAILGVRVIGTVAEAQVRESNRRLTPSSAWPTRSAGPAAKDPGPLLRGLVGMKHALEQGTTGAVMQQVDPVPQKLYSVLSKIGLMTSSESSVERFLSYPGVQPLAEHPKIIALRDDPGIARDVLARDYLALVRNPHIVEAANDEGIRSLLGRLEFEKALDHAVNPGGAPAQPAITER